MDVNKNLILVIDDNPANLQVLGNQLRDRDMEIAVATSGAKGIEIAKAKSPDLILLDIMMPEMDGYEVCERLKSEDRTKDIPVIFLTARMEEDDIVKGFSLGAVDYITKPFMIAELRARVRTHLKMKEYKEEIERKNEKLHKLNTEKNELLGIAAHDLKNPIYNISMLGRVLRDEPGLNEEERLEFAGDIISTSEKMIQLITRLLDLNAIETGKVTVGEEPVIIDEVVSAQIDSYKDRASAKNITLHFDKSEENMVARADRSAVLQVLDNLISNAVKYSPFDRNVYIRQSKHNDYIRIEVEDEGPGLTSEDKKQLFGKFAKLSAKPTGEESSTGLGLSIVKKYAELMNGRIWCESEPGQGANFILELPAYEEGND
jgi:signal transduction histidine kinase